MFSSYLLSDGKLYGCGEIHMKDGSLKKTQVFCEMRWWVWVGQGKCVNAFTLPAIFSFYYNGGTAGCEGNGNCGKIA